ncbi:MAG: DUF1653 domain-containing protein [Bacteroidales bacterium]
MLKTVVEEAVSRVNDLNIYRHYTGELYLVLNVAYCEELKEELVIYRSVTNNGGAKALPVSLFREFVAEGVDNPFKQERVFEPVRDFGKPIREVPTKRLVEELMTRADSPYIGLDEVELNDKVWRVDYIVGHYFSNYIDKFNTVQDFNSVAVYDTLGDAVNFAKKYGEGKYEVMKVVRIKQGF